MNARKKVILFLVVYIVIALLCVAMLVMDIMSSGQILTEVIFGVMFIWAAVRSVMLARGLRNMPK